MRVPSAPRFCGVALILLGVSLVTACGGGSSNGGGGGGGGGISVPAVPTGLTATAGNRQVSLTWNASPGASSYALARSATSGGPYAALASPSTTSYTDSAVIGGTTYYYVVAAVNSAGTSANSAQVSATPTVPSNAVTVTVDVLSNRHVISPYVYGGAFPKDAATISTAASALYAGVEMLLPPTTGNSAPTTPITTTSLKTSRFQH